MVIGYFGLGHFFVIRHSPLIPHSGFVIPHFFVICLSRQIFV